MIQKCIPILGNTGKDVVRLMISNSAEPLEIVKEKGWLRITDKETLQNLCNELMDKNAKKVRSLVFLFS
jgi:aspartyl-tRNA(Asn)/glutamyl-tRNA(Gln) amidotransferase subunit B